MNNNTLLLLLLIAILFLHHCSAASSAVSSIYCDSLTRDLVRDIVEGKGIVSDDDDVPMTNDIEVFEEDVNEVMHNTCSPITVPVEHFSTIDTDLYSRQLLVYGRSAQLKLQESLVVILDNGTPLCDEIVKNLAMAGVGKLTILKDSSFSQSNKGISLRSKESLANYAKSLNPLMQVTETAVSFDVDNIASEYFIHANAVVVPDGSFRLLKKINAALRASPSSSSVGEMEEQSRSRTTFTACTVLGNCGFVFNDFQREFEVVDVDGEREKEVPLLSATSAGEDGISPDSHLIRVTCIDEEKMEVGIGDAVEITSPSHLFGTGAGDSDTRKAITVRQVENVRSCVLSIGSGVSIEDLLVVINSGKSTFKKIKATATVTHAPLSSQLLNPTFISCNGCASPKTDSFTSLTLLACFKSWDVLRSGHAKPNANMFRCSVQQDLDSMAQRFYEKDKKAPSEKLKKDIFESVVERFRLGSRCNGRCPATESVIGAVTSQEVIKAITHVYMPVSQFLVFESLDSLHSDGDSEGIEENGIDLDDRSACESVYGSEIAEELKRMKVFVVGSGAIGCELLKNFAFLNISSSPPERDDADESTDHRCLWNSKELRNGGLVVTDMDHIERSNLNRQLLFRQQHVGQAKSIVAAAEVKKLNPHLHVLALTQKLSADAEASTTTGDYPFGASFWQDVDVVVTALDNIDARRYVDEMCVVHGRWMLDSGTLGTKGNTQGVIPNLTESYSSSADPPEEAIPLCTLKSFPYKAEHCVSWAKDFYEQIFNADIQALRTGLSELRSSEYDQIENWLQGLNQDDLVRVWENLKVLSELNASTDAKANALKWSLSKFHQFFDRDVSQLLVKHPPDSLEEEEDGRPGRLFWGGSRRIPTPINFNLSDPLHKSFVIHAAVLKNRCLGISGSLSAVQPTLTEEFSAYEETLSTLLTTGYAPDSFDQIPASAQLVNECKERIESIRLSTPSPVLISMLHPEEFDKDNLDLGHVALVAAASNLRCRIYSIHEIENNLEIRRIAGNIVPALATTTSLVAGLVSLELIKIASERIMQRKRVVEEAFIADERTKHEENVSQSDDQESPDHLLSWKDIITGIVIRPRKKYKLPGAPWWRKRRQPEKQPENDQFNATTSTAVDEKKRDDGERMLKRFRNSFVNLARPILSFAQPVPAEEFSILHGDSKRREHFTIWDHIEAPTDAAQLTLHGLFSFINSRFGYGDATGDEYLQIQSVSMTDTLIYADFLPDSDAILHEPILSVLKSSLEKEILGDGDGDDEDAQAPLPTEAVESAQPEEQDEVSNDATTDDSATASEEDEAESAEEDEGGDEDDDEENVSAAPQPDDDESAAAEKPDEGEDNEEEVDEEGKEEVDEEGAEQVGAEEGEYQQDGDDSKQEHDSDASYVTTSAADSSPPRDRQSAAAKEARRRLDLLSFVDFNVVCVRKRKPSNANNKGSRSAGAEEGEEEDDDEDEVSEDVKLPPVRVRLVRQKPLCDREILSSLFDAAEKQEQDRNRRKGSREKSSTAATATTTTSNNSKSLVHTIADSVRSASLYMLAYSVQYLVIHFLLIVFFKEVYIKKLRQ